MLRLTSTLTVIYAHIFKRFNIIEMAFAPFDRVMLDAHVLSAIAELLVKYESRSPITSTMC